jgi:ribonuclease J
MQNLLVKSGVEVVTTDTDDNIHVSGHPDKQAVAKMYGWLHPKTLIPIHGDARMLYAHKTFANENGISKVLVAESGDVISFSDGKLRKMEHKEIVFNAIDCTDLIPLNSKAIRERNAMSYGGHVGVSFILSSNGKSCTSLDAVISGIYIDNDNSKRLEKLIYQVIDTEIAKNTGNIKLLKNGCELSIKKLILRHFDKRPIITVHVHKI